MQWRRAKQPLTPHERREYEYHRGRLLRRHQGHLTPGLIRCLEANASRLARHPEILTPEWGLKMGRIKGARHAHAVMRGEGRTPGAEGRAKIAENRKLRAEEKRLATIAALSSVTVGEKGADGLTREQRAADPAPENCTVLEC